MSTAPAPVEPVATPATVEPPETDVQRVAREAAIAVPGVHALGVEARRRLASALGRVPASRLSVGRGVNAEVGPTQTAVDLALVLDLGVRIPEVSAEVRRAVMAAVPGQTGLEVVEVNVDVIDLHAPGDPEPGDPAPQETATPAAAEPEEVDVDVVAPADPPAEPEGPDTARTDPAAAAVAAAVDRVADPDQPEDVVIVTDTVVTTTVIEPGAADPTDSTHPADPAPPVRS